MHKYILVTEHLKENVDENKELRTKSRFFKLKCVECTSRCDVRGGMMGFISKIEITTILSDVCSASHHTM